MSERGARQGRGITYSLSSLLMDQAGHSWANSLNHQLLLIAMEKVICRARRNSRISLRFTIKHVLNCWEKHNTCHIGYTAPKVCLGPCGAEIRISVANGTVGNHVTGNISSFSGSPVQVWLLSVCQTAVALGVCPKNLMSYLTLQ